MSPMMRRISLSDAAVQYVLSAITVFGSSRSTMTRWNAFWPSQFTRYEFATV